MSKRNIRKDDQQLIEVNKIKYYLKMSYFILMQNEIPFISYFYDKNNKIA